jgi:GT2 family glycosyltransferase
MISAIITAYNAEKYIGLVLDSILAQTKSPDEIIIVDDESKDKTSQIAAGYKNKFEKKKIKFLLIKQKNKGPAGASNTAIKKASGKYIVSVDSDAILDKDFIEKAINTIDGNEKLGAVGGYIRTANRKSFWAKIMGYDLEYRYDHIGGHDREKATVTHISPNNTVYRKEIFDKIGLFNEQFQYAQDVDFSYRMIDAGYKIMLLKKTGCEHYWKESFLSYIQQQYRSAYGRMMVIFKKTENIKGDSVAGGIRMIIQIPFTCLGLICVCLGLINPIIMTAGIGLLAVVIIERYFEAIYLLRKKKDVSMLIMPFVHIMRNVIWGIASLGYIKNRLIYRK